MPINENMKSWQNIHKTSINIFVGEKQQKWKKSKEKSCETETKRAHTHTHIDHHEHIFALCLYFIDMLFNVNGYKCPSMTMDYENRNTHCVSFGIPMGGQTTKINWNTSLKKYAVVELVFGVESFPNRYILVYVATARTQYKQFAEETFIVRSEFRSSKIKSFFFSSKDSNFSR